MPLRLLSRKKRSHVDEDLVRIANPQAEGLRKPHWRLKTQSYAFKWLKHLIEDLAYELESKEDLDNVSRIHLIMHDETPTTDGHVLIEGSPDAMKRLMAYICYLEKTIIVVDDHRRSLVPGVIHCTRANQAVSLLRRFADEGRVVDELWLDHWLDPGSIEPVVKWLLRNKHAKQHGVPQLQIEAIYVHASDYSKREETVKRLSGQYKNVSSRDLPDRRECLPDLFTQDEMWQY